VQFERQMASSCELLSLSLDRTMLLAVGGWRLVQFDFLFVAECLQSQNHIGDAGAIFLGEGLKCNSSVEKLHLVSC
jgi:hypothetical protein